MPPPTKADTRKALNNIINLLKGSKTEEKPPEWESHVDFPGLGQLLSEIQQKQIEHKKVISELEILNNKVESVAKLRRLLWSDGDYLENAVKEAFNMLGFSEIRKIRSANLEDWIIDFRYVPKFKYGVFEIKGAEKRTSLANLTQCNKWVEDYLLDDKQVKGIFVPNQYRLADVEQSSKEREEFAPNEFEYARTREICILTSSEIFSALSAKTKGSQNLTREIIENKIADATGLCKLL